MSKKTRMFGKGIATMFFLFIASNHVWAGDTYYRDCDVKVNSPSTAQGLVYVDVDTDRPSRAYKFHSSAPGQSAQVKANFKALLSDYECRLLAYPKPGYAVAGFVTKEDYLAGRKNNFIASSSGDVYKSGSSSFKIAKGYDSEKSEEDPTSSSSYSFSAKSTVEFYAIFKPATSATVTVSTPGGLKYALSQTGKGEDISDIVVKGTINDQDLAYLKSLVNNNNLIRIDLSGARISVIPEKAFSSCYSLYEIKLPISGLTTIGSKAFSSCHTLKKVTIPSSVTYKSSDLFDECYSLNKGF